MFFSNRFCVWILHSTELRTYFPSLVGWFMTRVFTTSAGVPISAATRPEHTLQKQGNLTMIASDGHSTKVHCQCILARSDQYHDCPFPTSQCTPKLQCSCPNSSFIQVKQERQVNPLLGTRWPFVYFLQGREFQDGRPKMGMCTEHGISVECMHGSECNKL